MSLERPIILCAFSNDFEYRLRLEDEERSIREALQELDSRKQIEYKPIGQATLNVVYNTFNRYHDMVCIFHYGGHSSSEFLYLKNQSARSSELAILIGQQKHLKLVFLNGCANRPQVQALLEQGVPAVIATSESIGDNQAIILAEQFYKALANGKTIQQSFETAKSYLRQAYEDMELVRERGCQPREESSNRPFSWGLYYENETVLDWHIGQITQESKKETLSTLREASRRRHQKFTNQGGRFQNLDIHQAIIAGIRNVSPNRKVRFEENIELDGERMPLLESVSSLWNSSNPHSLLVGPGGMGKTVSLLRLWERWSLEEGVHIPVPIFIQLNEFNNNPEKNFIQNYIQQHYANLKLDEIFKIPNIDQKGKTYPNILLLLDGFNEVVANSDVLVREINRLRMPDDSPGIQIVLSSRGDIRAAYQWQSFHFLELQPLSDLQIQTYLGKNIPTELRLLDVLRNPMMLSIYAPQSELPQHYVDRGLLKDQVTSNGELLFNMEVIQRIKIEEQYSTQHNRLILNRFILEHLLPFLGWKMQQEGRFSIEETGRGSNLYLSAFLMQFINEIIQDDFFIAFSDFRKLDTATLKKLEVWKMQELFIDQISCNQLTLLVPENGVYRFLHQNFRDYFAARHVQNSIYISLKKNELPLTLQQDCLDPNIRKLLGELEGIHYNKPLPARNFDNPNDNYSTNNSILNKTLKQCKGIYDNKKIGFTVWNILTIFVEVRGCLSDLDLSQLDLYPFYFFGEVMCRPGFNTFIQQSILYDALFLGKYHTRHLVDIKLSPDGSSILTRSLDGIGIWDIRTSKCLFKTHEDIYDDQRNSHRNPTKPYIKSADFSPDGRYFFIIFSPPFPAVIYKKNSLIPFHNFGEEWLDQFFYTPDGEQILALYPKSLISFFRKEVGLRIFDSHTKSSLFEMRTRFNQITSATYSLDGNYLLIGFSNGMIKILDAKNKDILFELRGHRKRITYLVFSNNSKLFISVSRHDIKVWDIDKRECVLTISDNTSKFSKASFSPDNSKIIINCKIENENFKLESIIDPGLTRKRINFWDLATGKQTYIYNSNLQDITNAVYSPDGSRLLITTYNSNIIEILDSNTGEKKSEIDEHGLIKFVQPIFSLDGRSLITARHNFQVIIRSLLAGESAFSFWTGNVSGFQSIAFDSSGGRLITGAWDGTVKIWDTSEGICFFTLKGHSDFVINTKFSNDDKYILSISYDRSAKIWDAIKGECLLTIKDSTDSITCGAFSPNNEFLLTSSFEGALKIWDIRNGNCLFKIKGHGSGIIKADYSPNGKHILSLSTDHTVRIWDAQNGEYIFSLKDDTKQTKFVTYSPDGVYIFTCTLKNTLRIWDANTGYMLIEFEEFDFDINSITVSQDSSKVVVTSNHVVQIWDINRRICLLAIEDEKSLIKHGVLSLNQKQLYTLTSYEIKIWDAINGSKLNSLPYNPNLIIHGCDFRNMHPNSKLSPQMITILRQYGGFFNDKDVRIWKELMEKHFGIVAQ